VISSTINQFENKMSDVFLHMLPPAFTLDYCLEALCYHLFILSRDNCMFYAGLILGKDSFNNWKSYSTSSSTLPLWLWIFGGTLVL